MIVLVLMILAPGIGWIVGEAADLRVLRRICAPLCAAAITYVAVAVAELEVRFDESIRFSAATKDLVSAVVEAIDRGDVELAHAELRQFDESTIVTYERGEFLHDVDESVARLKESQ